MRFHLTTPFAAQSDAGPTIDMLNAMQQLLTGDSEFFDPAFLGELLQVRLPSPKKEKIEYQMIFAP